MIGGRLGTSFARPTLARIAEASGGNPFFALEIARALASDANEHPADRPLPVPRDVQELAVERVRALSSGARDAVLVAAPLSRPTLRTIADALPAESDPCRQWSRPRMRAS